MDPVSIGIAIGISLIERYGGKLIAKAADPVVVAKSINWVFSAADNLLKIIKKEKSRDSVVPAPPSSAPGAPSKDMISDSEIEDKTEAAKEVINSAKNSIQEPDQEGIKLEVIDEFAMEQLASEVESLLNQIETYLGNLRFEEEKAAQFGGLKFSPPIVMNTIRIQQEEISKRLLRLNKCMQKAYNTSAPNLEVLFDVTKNQ